jgi:hypothetical protein
MNIPLKRMTGMAAGCLISLAVVGCARNATEPSQRDADATPVMAPAAPPEPAPEVVAVVPPGPIVEPLAEGNAAPSAPVGDAAMTTSASPTMQTEPASNSMLETLPPRADRN